MNKKQFLHASIPFDICMCKEGKTPLRLHCGNYNTLVDNEKRIAIVHPLSDLTNLIIHNGEKFVPIIELAKISMIGDEAERFEITKNKKYITVYFENKETFSFSIKFMSFYSTIGNKSQIAPYQLNLFQKLIEWHFDVAGLIEKGEAIDVNALSENPYK